MQRDMPERAAPLVLPLLLPDQDPLVRQVDVRPLAGDDLAPPRAGVGGEGNHRVQEGVPRLDSDVLQHLADLVLVEIQRLPEFRLSVPTQVARGDDRLDLLPGPKGLLVGLLAEGQLEGRDGRTHVPAIEAPAPDVGERR